METFIRAQRSDEQRLCSLLSFDDITAVVLAAALTNVMLALQLTAVGALLISSTSEGIMRPTHIAFRFRNFLLGNSHLQTLKSNAIDESRLDIVVTRG